MEKHTQLAINSDAGALDIINVLKAERDKLKKEAERTPFTDGKIAGANGSSVNLHSEKDITNIVDAIGSLIIRKQLREEGLKALKGSSAPEIDVQKFIEDANSRISFLQHADRMKELDALIEEAAKFTTLADQKSMFIEKVKAFSSK